MAELKEKGWETVAGALKDLAQTKAKMQAIEAGYEVKINALKEESEKETRHMKADIAKLEKDIETYCGLRKKEFDEVRTREFEFGSVGYRKTPPSIALLPKWTWKKALEKALELQGKFRKAMRVKTEFDKDELKSFDLSDLKKIGLTVDDEDAFQLDVKTVLIDD